MTIDREAVHDRSVPHVPTTGPKFSSIFLQASRIHCGRLGTTGTFFFLFRAAPVVYGGSQASGQIGATAAGLHHSHSNSRSKPLLQPTPQLMATLDP